MYPTPSLRAGYAASITWLVQQPAIIFSQLRTILGQRQLLQQQHRYGAAKLNLQKGDRGVNEVIRYIGLCNAHRCLRNFFSLSLAWQSQSHSTLLSDMWSVIVTRHNMPFGLHCSARGMPTVHAAYGNSELFSALLNCLSHGLMN